MKKYIFIISAFLLGFTSCNDFLDVNSASKYEESYVLGSKDEANRVLTSVYASLMSNNAYGNNYMSEFALNSDVEFSAYSSSIRHVNGRDYKCFDGTSNGSSVSGLWTTVYGGIERANIFINGIQESPIFQESDTTVMQLLGEAKVLRAMFYHDLIVHFGDIPFSTESTYNRESMVMPITDRNEILTFLIDDLKEIAPKMQYASKLQNGIERASREFCYAMIARMALTRGGYALYPDKGSPLSVGTMQRQNDYREYYEIAKTYADSVIISGTHALRKPFNRVFIDQCNYIVDNGDDPIFEIPFVKNQSGNVGYIHGPQGQTTNSVSEGENVWGASGGSLRLNAFYRYSFDRQDLRLDHTVGMWYYTSAGVPTVRTDYSTHANKWSKFWTDRSLTLGTSSSERTGINYPYMRYADVLLMYAEAVNELENGVSGPNGAKAKEALKQVRQRAFAQEAWGEKVDGYIASASGSKESFFQAIFNERKWEFGGENMRWKDLVRWNLYSEVVYDSFMEYLIVGNIANGNYLDGYEDYMELPMAMFYKRVDNPNDINIYPNTTLQIIEFYNPYESAYNPGTDSGYTLTADFYAWGDDNSEYPRAQCLYSFRGYVRDGEGSNYESLNPNNLPPVRYILPIPNNVIQMSNGEYRNYYGYN